eukprot:3253336-Rhodomonas_salina.2
MSVVPKVKTECATARATVTRRQIALEASAAALKPGLDFAHLDEIQHARSQSQQERESASMREGERAGGGHSNSVAQSLVPGRHTRTHARLRKVARLSCFR